MSYEEDSVIQTWVENLNELNVKVKKMFGCYCLYCDDVAVGWLHDGVLSLREVGLSFLPQDVKRPKKDDKIQELVIPFDYASAEWLPKAVQSTADILKQKRH